MPTKLTTEQFTTKSTLIHNNKYDYELVEYTHSKAKVKIICPIHGIFEQVPNNHLQGKGCPHCCYEAKAKTQLAIAKSEFEEKASIVHNSKYDYSLVDYKNAKAKVKIVCNKHGSFEQEPRNHLTGQRMPCLCFNRNRMDSYTF